MSTPPAKSRHTKGLSKPVRKTTRTRRHQPEAAGDESPSTSAESEEQSHAPFDPDLRHRMITEAAYYLFAQRGYIDGYDVDDWLEAEAQIDDLIMNPEREDTQEVSAPLASP